MNTCKFWTKCLLILFLSTITISCNDDDQPKEQTPANYVVGFQANPIGTEQPIDYVLEVASLKEGVINANNKGVPQTGWRFFHQTGKTLFTAGYSTDVTCRSFYVDNRKLIQEKAVFTFQSTLDFFKNIDNKTTIAIQLDRSGTGKKRIHIINATTGQVEKIVEHEIDIDKGDGTPENQGTLPWVTGLVKNGNRLFISYYKIVNGDENVKTADEKRAYVAVFSYPEFTLEKIIYDDRTSPIGNNGHNTGLVQTEDGDIYSYSSSALSGGFWEASKPSGILKIKNGTTEFDKEYFFNVETAPNGGKIFWMDYVGNGKAIARIINNDATGPWTTYLGKNNVKMVIIDFNAKTVTDVKGVPNHGQRYTAPAYVENGKVYMSVSTEEETRIYIVDPTNAKAVKGAKVEGLSLKGIFKII